MQWFIDNFIDEIVHCYLNEVIQWFIDNFIDEIIQCHLNEVIQCI